MNRKNFKEIFDEKIKEINKMTPEEIMKKGKEARQRAINDPTMPAAIRDPLLKIAKEKGEI